jgi:hypothetical protein
MRVTAAIVTVTGLSLLLAACGGPASPGIVSLGTTTTSTPSGAGGNSGATASNYADAVRFSQCMRAKGVLNYPDPASSGTIPKLSLSQLGVSGSRFQSAQRACQHLLPNSGSGPNQAQLQQQRALGVRFATCMRHHDVALPDPGSDGRIPDPATLGIDQGSPQFEAANQACGKYRPPYMPSNSQYNAYARSQG